MNFAFYISALETLHTVKETPLIKATPSLFYVPHISSPWHMSLRWTLNLVKTTVFKKTVDLGIIDAGWEAPILMFVSVGRDCCVCRHKHGCRNLSILGWECFPAFWVAAVRERDGDFSSAFSLKTDPKALTHNQLAWPPASLVSPTSCRPAILDSGHIHSHHQRLLLCLLPNIHPNPTLTPVASPT